MESLENNYIKLEKFSSSNESDNKIINCKEELEECNNEASENESSGDDDTEDSCSNTSDNDKVDSVDNDFIRKINYRTNINNNDIRNKSQNYGSNQAKTCNIVESQKQTAVTLEPPDGGWGWAVVIGGIIVLALTALLGPCFGMLFSRPLLEMGASSTSVAWIFNIRMLIRQTCTILVGPLAKQFGWRIIGVIGGAFVGISIFLCAFGKVPEYFYFSYAIVGGIGGALAMSIPFIIVPFYFKNHLGKANSVMILGISLGQILGPTFIRYLQDQFSFMGATIILSAIFLHCIPGAMLFHPVEWYMKPARNQTEVESPLISSTKSETNDETIKRERTSHYLQKRRSTIISEYSVDMSLEMMGMGQSVQDLRQSTITQTYPDISEEPKEVIQITDDIPTVWDTLWIILKDSLYSLKILSSMRALIICIGSASIFNGFFNFFVFIPFALQSDGYDLQAAAYCISMSAFCNTCTRFVLIFISDKPWFNTRLCYMIGCTIMVLMTIAFPLMPSLWWMIAVMGLWGIGLSLNITFNNVLMVQYMGLDNLSAVYGASNFISGFGFIIVGPLIGMIRDVSGSYVVAVHVLAGVLSLCLLLWVFMPQAEAYDAKRTTKTPQPSNNV